MSDYAGLYQPLKLQMARIELIEKHNMTNFGLIGGQKQISLEEYILTSPWIFICITELIVSKEIWLVAQALDTIKKAGSSFPKDHAKKLEKEVSSVNKLIF